MAGIGGMAASNPTRDTQPRTIDEVRILASAPHSIRITMRRRTSKNYPRRKAWVVLANHTDGDLAVLTSTGKFARLREGYQAMPKVFTTTDRALEYYNPKRFTKAGYKDTEAKAVLRAQNQAALTSLVVGWEPFIARLGSAKCPVDFTEKDGKIFLTLKQENNQ